MSMETETNANQEAPRHCPESASNLYCKELDVILQRIKLGQMHRKSRERSLAITKIEEAIMWLDADRRKQMEERISRLNAYDYTMDTSQKPVDE